MKIPRGWLFLTAMVSILFGYFVSEDVMAYVDAVAIKAHGKAAVADVNQVYIDGCGRRVCLWRVDYTFTITGTNAGNKVEFSGSDLLGNDRYPHDPHWLYAKRTGRVPIAFDITKPNRSTLNFEGAALSGKLVDKRSDHLKFGIMLYLIVIAAVTVAMLAMRVWDRLIGGDVRTLSAA